MKTKKTSNDLETVVRRVVKEEVRKETKFLPTKEEFYSKMDELMGEIKAVREEITVVTGYKDQIEDHETRITKIETVLTPQ